MKKLLKSIIKKSFKKSKKSDTLFNQNIISLDDKKNKKFLDNISYQEYLKKLNYKDNDNNE